MLGGFASTCDRAHVWKYQHARLLQILERLNRPKTDESYRSKLRRRDTYFGIGPQHHYQKDSKDGQERDCNVTESQHCSLHIHPFPEKRLTSERAIPHCPRFAGEHWNTKPVNVDIRSKADDAEVEEYGELEKDPGLRVGSSFVPLLLNVPVEIGATALFAARLLF